MKSKICIGIDPANAQSAFCVYDGDRIIECELIDNGSFFGNILDAFVSNEVSMVYIEDVTSYGMPVGETVFSTCKYIGRLQLLLEQNNIPYEMVRRLDIKLHHCFDSRAKDSNIRAALIERFGGKGTKKDKGFFYGIAGNDKWSACAIAIYGSDKLNGR